MARSYSTPSSRYTLMQALALEAITGRARCATSRTRMNLLGLRDFDAEDARRAREPRWYGVILTAEGEALLAGSRLWKAHQYLLSQGFRLDQDRRRYSARYLPYVHRDDSRRTAFTGGSGAVYAMPERPQWWVEAELSNRPIADDPELGRRWREERPFDHRKVAHFRNGEEG